jgi:hypothetical protein
MDNHSRDPSQDDRGSGGTGNLLPLTENWGGYKNPSSELWAGALNYLDVGAFLTHMTEINWTEPDQVQILVPGGGGRLLPPLHDPRRCVTPIHPSIGRRRPVVRRDLPSHGGWGLAWDPRGTEDPSWDTRGTHRQQSVAVFGRRCQRPNGTPNCPFGHSCWWR